MAVSVLVEGERLRFNWDFGSARAVVGSREMVLVEVQEGGVASILWLILNPPRAEDQGSRRNIHAREKEKKMGVYVCT